MKKTLILVLFLTVVFSCKTTPTSIPLQLLSINEAIGKEWKLVEIRVNNKNIDFDRSILMRDGFDGYFTLNIEEEQIYGTGAPNRYSAPYTASETDQLTVSIATVRSTLMASIYQPEKLREHEFFIYLQNTYKWGLLNDNLVLHSKTDNNKEVVMVFSL